MSTGIGEALRAARRQQGRSLADAAAATRVRESYLAALEEEEFGALGGDVYVKGFLRSYAKYLGLNPEPLIEAYRREFERGDEPPPVTRTVGPPLNPDGRDGLPRAAMLIGLVLLLIAAVVVFRGGDEDEPTVPAPPPVEESESPLAGVSPTAAETVSPTAAATETLDPNAPAEPASETPADEPTDEPTQEPTEVRSETRTVEGERLRVRLVVDEPGSFIRVVSDGTLRSERDYEAGTDLIYEAEQTILFRIHNAAAVRLVVNGESQGELGDPDEVVEIRFVLAS